MGLGELIQTLINEHGSSAILRERLLLLQDRVKALEDEMLAAKAKIRQLTEKNVQLEQDLAAVRTPDEFVEHRGALFKRKGSGGYHQAVFCPDCRGAMFAVDPEMPFYCQKCHRGAPFTGNDLPAILRELSI